jgi:hypothetical protein
MTDQTSTNAATAADSAAAGAVADGAGRVPRRRPGGPVLAAVLGLVLGLLALGPGLRPGYLLSYDMVFVPQPPLNPLVLGTSGVPARAVPSDAVMAVLARALPADVVQKLVLLAIFVLACAGAARLLRRQPLAAQLTAGAAYAWNPFVGERLILGQWALLLGYAGLPWVLAEVTSPPAGAGGRAAVRRGLRIAAALVPAAIGGFAAMCVSGLVALPASLLRRHERGPAALLRATAGPLAVLAALSLPWLIPSLSQPVMTSPAGVAAFAARADTPAGTAGSLIALGGAWNAQTVPAGYTGAGTLPWLCLGLIAVAAFGALGRRRWPGLGLAAIAGLALALVGATPPGQDALRWLISWWPGFAILRDGQQFIAPLALAEAAGLGLLAGWLPARLRRAGLEAAGPVLAAALVLAPVLFLPGLAVGAAGRLRPAEYPADWLAARRMINADGQPGRALLLPWGAYRRFGWNHGEAVLDPWPRLLTRPVSYDDGVQVGSLTVPPESQAARTIGPAVTGTGPLTAALQADGYRYVIVDAGPDPAALATRLPGCVQVLSGPGLAIFRVPDAR